MSMAIQPVSVNTYSAPKSRQSITFQGEQAPKKETHMFKAIASAAFPGVALGQFLDGRFGSGFKHIFGMAGLSLASKVLAVAGLAAKNKYVGIASIVASSFAGIGAFATYIHSIVDAYRGGKKA